MIGILLALLKVLTVQFGGMMTVPVVPAAVIALVVAVVSSVTPLQAGLEEAALLRDSPAPCHGKSASDEEQNPDGAEHQMIG
jgi:sugar phosphate permease